MNARFLRIAKFTLALLFVSATFAAKPPKDDSLLLIVTDPLSRELACACVKGYGQRDYRKLAAKLESTIKQRVTIEFSDDIAETLASIAPSRDILLIGDESLVTHGAKKAHLKSHAICELTDTEGDATHTASIIVRSDDPARELKDIRGRRIFFGLPETDEKYKSSLATLRESGLELPDKAEKHLAYTDAALDLLDSGASPLPVAVIPSYAMRMLEGCGSVTPGNLRVIAKSKPSRFITVFISDATPMDKQQKIIKALLAIKSDAKLLNALESRDGFKPIETGQGSKPTASADWPDWRGPNRDGHVAQLPSHLPSKPKIVWKNAVVEGGLSGLSVSNNRLISAERDFADENDVYRCFNTSDGELIWQIHFPARGKLDFGQSPRATPVFHRDRVYLLGAFGDLRCVNAATGKMIWQRNLQRDFRAPLPTWGFCSPPLIVDDVLIVNPGATNASLAALDLNTGRTRWTTPGHPAAYAPFISAPIAGARQIVGYDKISLGGWEPKTGKRLWQIIPSVEGDFNVPTPIAFANGVFVATENNGARLYSCASAEKFSCQPTATFADLKPDTSTPVLVNNRLFGSTHQNLFCLSAADLKPIWQHTEDALGDHTTFLADAERVLIISLSGELILIDAKADKYSILSRLRLLEDDVELYSHPALVGSRFYARAGSILACFDLNSESL